MLSRARSLYKKGIRLFVGASTDNRQMKRLWRWARFTANDTVFVLTSSATTSRTSQVVKLGATSVQKLRAPWDPTVLHRQEPVLLLIGDGDDQALAASLVQLLALNSVTHVIALAERGPKSRHFLHQLVPIMSLVDLHMLEPVFYSDIELHTSKNRRQQKSRIIEQLESLIKSAAKSSRRNYYKPVFLLITTTAYYQSPTITETAERKKNNTNKEEKIDMLYDNLDTYHNKKDENKNDYEKYDGKVTTLERWLLELGHVPSLLQLPWFYLDTRLTPATARVPRLSISIAQHRATTLNLTTLLPTPYSGYFKTAEGFVQNSGGRAYQAAELLAHFGRTWQMMRGSEASDVIGFLLQQQQHQYFGGYWSRKINYMPETNSLASGAVDEAVYTAVRLVPQETRQRRLLADSTSVSNNKVTHEYSRHFIWLTIQRLHITPLVGGTTSNSGATYYNRIASDFGAHWHVITADGISAALKSAPLNTCSNGRLRVLARDVLSGAPLRYSSRLHLMKNDSLLTNALLIPAEKSATVEIFCSPNETQIRSRQSNGNVLLQTRMQCPGVGWNGGRTIHCFTESIWIHSGAKSRGQISTYGPLRRLLICRACVLDECQKTKEGSSDFCVPKLLELMQLQQEL